MAIVVACRCGKRFAAPPALSGSRQNCPSCGTGIDVPAASSAVEVEDWLLDGLSDSELTSIAELTRSGAAQGRRTAKKHGFRFDPARWLSLRRWSAGGRALVSRIRLTPLTIGLALLFAAVPAVLIAYLVWEQQATNQLAAERAWVVENEEPLSLQDLSDSYQLGAEQGDATAQWLSGVETLTTPAFERFAGHVPVVGYEETERSFPPPSETWPEIELHEAEMLLNQFHEELTQLHVAARSAGAARYPLEFEAGGETASLRHRRLERGARLLSVESHVRAHQGAIQGAVDSLQTMLRLTATLQEEPSLAAHEQMLECHRLACDRVRRLLGYVEFTPQQIEQLRHDLQTLDVRRSLYVALRGDRVRGAAAMQAADPTLADSEVGPLSKAAPRLTTATDEDAAFYLICMNRAVFAAQLPLPEALAEAIALDHEFDRTLTSTLWGEKRYRRSIELVPSMHELFAAAADAQTLQLAADAALAAELYRLRTGVWPLEWSNLTPGYLSAIPADPRTGRPLHCGRTGDAFFVASDTGDAAPAARTTNLTFRVPHENHRR